MIALIQRVSQAKVDVEGTTIGSINQGLLVLLGVQAGDTTTQADALLKKVLSYRVFADDDGKMNLSLLDIGGELLVVSQFTLAANTGKGLRPSFSSAAAPNEAKDLYDYFVEQATPQLHTQTGEFGADMQVSLTNDGPVTFWLEV